MAYESEFSLFVGDLAFDVDDQLLQGTFGTYYPSVRSAKVMVDPVTQRSRGFGFVRFSLEAERDRAINEMNGVYIGSKPVRVSLATARPNVAARGIAPPFGAQSAGGAPTGVPPPTGAVPPGAAAVAPSAPGAGPPGHSGELDPTNTTLFVGGLSAAVSEAELHAAFAACGEIVYTKIPPGKGCGFVQFVQRPSAEYALEHMNGYMLGGMPIRVSWGKSSRPPGPGVHLAGAAGAAAHHAPGGVHHAPGGYAGAYAGYPAAAGYADPYAAAGAYGLPYGAAGYEYGAAGYGAAGYGAVHDPAYAGYGYAAGPGSATLTSPGSGATSNTAASTGTTAGGTGYDPLGPVNVDKLNMQYMQRHVPVLAGHYVRVPIAMPVQHM